MEPCQEYEALISAVTDGEATEAERRALMEHLSRCADCREAYTQSLLLHDAFSQWEEEAPPELRAAVMEQVRKEPRQKKRSRRSWLPLMAAAACLALIVVGYQVRGTLTPAAVTPPMQDDAGLDAGAPEKEPSVTAKGEEPAEAAKDPEPQVGSDVTQYGTGGVSPDETEDTQPRMEAPQVTAFAQMPPSMTVTCADPALLTWMETNVEQAGTETEKGTVWIIPVADWLKLEVRLLDGGCDYTVSGEKISDQLTDGDLVEVIYQAAPES